MSYLEIITCVFLTVSTILLIGFTARFYYGWIDDAIKGKVAREKLKQSARPENELNSAV